jgi:hypothetical protein
MKLKVLATTLPTLAALLVGFFGAPAAHAQLNFALTPAGQAGNPGDTLQFTGTLSNPTASEVFLNGDSYSGLPAGLTLDDTPFFSNAPLSLQPAGSMDGSGNPTDSYTGGFFNIAIDPSVTPGTYTGTFAITGGADSNASDTVATEDFSVTVNPSPVPEASSVISFGLLLALGAGGVIVAARKKKAQPTL